MPESLAELLREFRSRAHLSQEALAERAAISARTVSDIETGIARTPRLVTIMLLAEALSLPEAERARLQEAGRKPRVGVRDGASRASATGLRSVVLVGRDDDAREVRNLIARDDVQLLTLWGPPGVGKTSLALRVAADAAAQFPDGVSFIEFAAITGASSVPATLARALGLQESGGSSFSDAVADRLRTRRMLLVLDNLEHLTTAGAWLSSLLEACRELTLLVTSRELLHLRIERAYAVRALDERAAAELFAHRAQAVVPGFSVTPKNDAAIAAIVRRLDGLPLAIELAAPRLRLLPAKALAARLERRLPLLDEGALDVPHRHQTMRAAIAWSYDLLPPDEQCLFRYLCVFQGGASLDAARAVADTPAERSFLLRIAALIEKSIVSLDEAADGEPRVAMLETLREFGAERLAEAGEEHDALRRHATYFAQLAYTARGQLDGVDQATWLQRLEGEYANLQAALSWAYETRDTEFALRLSCALWRFWWMRGYLTEGAGWIRRILERADADETALPPNLRAEALRVYAVLLSALGDFEAALTLCERALDLYRPIGDDQGIAATLTSLGIARQFRGDEEGATSAHEESLGIRRRIGDETGIATSLSNLASIAVTTGDFARAEQLGDESAALYRRLGNARGVAHALTKLGLVAERLGKLDQAERLHEECLQLHRSLGSPANEFIALVNLGVVAHRRGNFRAALERYREALSYVDKVPTKAAIASTLESMAASIAAIGDERRAARIYGAAEALRDAIGSPRFASEREDYNAASEAARASLGPDVFEAERRIGSTMTLERAIDEARGADAAVAP